MRYNLWVLLAFILLLLCFRVAEPDPSYTQRDSIAFGVITTIGEADHNWDSCFAILYYIDDVLDTTELTLSDTGTWTGQHAPLSNSGCYMIKYVAYLSDEPTSYIDHFSIFDTVAFQGMGVTDWATVAKLNADSLNARYMLSQLLPMGKLMGAVGDSQSYFYNAAGNMDSMRYWSGNNLIARIIYVRTADTLAPRLTRTYIY